jgi:broad specificity phosphatase PhoE
MRSTSLILIRHAHVVDNDPGAHARLSGWTDSRLSSLGEREAQALARRLVMQVPRAVALYTSPLLRARATADAIGAALGLRSHLRAGLREISCGMLEGWPLQRVQARFPELWQRNLAQNDESFAWPGGETYRQFRMRVVRTIRALAIPHVGQRILVVTHAGVIAQIVGALRDESAARWSAYRPGNASVTEVRWHTTGGAVIRFDERLPLADRQAATLATRRRRAG